MLNIGAPLATVIGVFGTLVGWVIRENHERRQKRNDILIGLHAEIIAGGYAALRLSENSEQSLQNTKPFATADRTDFVFDSIKDDISILPAIVIHDVVRYYRLAERSNLLTDDLRHELFLQKCEAERLEFLRGLIGTVRDQSEAARDALNTIKDYARENLHSAVSLQLSKKRQRRAVKSAPVARTEKSDPC